MVPEARERRPPVGTARRRRANHVLPTGGMSRTCTATPVELPVAVRTIPLFEVRLARRATARLCRPEVGVPVPARRRAPRHFPPGHAGSEQSSLPLFLRARQYATTRESRRHGAPVSDRHRAGARNPHQQRCAPPISLLRTAHRRSALNRGDGSGNADLRSAPPAGGGRTTYCRLAGCPAPAPPRLLKYPLL